MTTHLGIHYLLGQPVPIIRIKLSPSVGALSHLVATAFSRRGLHAHGASSEDTLHRANSNMHPNLVKLPIMVALDFDCVHKI
jgi:hypothetical protein